MLSGNGSRFGHPCWLLFTALAGLLLSARAGGAPPNARLDVSPAGASTYLPGRWGTVQLTYVNLEEEPVELFSATFFDLDRSQQFCRKTWVPAKSRLILSHPIHLPFLEEGGKAFDFHSLLLDSSQGSEVLVRGSQRDLQQRGRLRLGEEPATAIMNMPDEFML